MSIYATRLSVVFVFALIGVSILSSAASAQDPGEMNFEFSDAEEFADFSPEDENEVAESPAVKLTVGTLIAGVIGALVLMLIAIIGAWKAFTKARKKRGERKHLLLLRDGVSGDMQPTDLVDPARDDPMPVDRVA